MTGIYTRGADLARDIVTHRQAHAANLTEAGALLDELVAIRDVRPDDAAAVLVGWLESAGQIGSLERGRDERAIRDRAQDARAERAGLIGGH